jgi:hypothetical protein
MARSGFVDGVGVFCVLSPAWKSWRKCAGGAASASRRCSAKHVEGVFACCLPFVVPFKHVAAPTIGCAVYEASCRCRRLYEIADDAMVARQTVGCWLGQLRNAAPAHVLQNTPVMASRFTPPPLAPVPAAVPSTPPPAPAASRIPGRKSPLRSGCVAIVARLMQWAVWVASATQGGAAAGVDEHNWLGIVQPALADMSPAAGVFRVQLCRIRTSRSSCPVRGPPQC